MNNNIKLYKQLQLVFVYEVGKLFIKLEFLYHKDIYCIPLTVMVRSFQKSIEAAFLSKKHIKIGNKIKLNAK